MARVVSVPLSPGAHPISALVRYFRPRQSLVILDNCAHLLASCATLCDALLASCATLCDALLRECAYLKILATSREPLGHDGELRWRVPSLALPTDEAQA
ncbi:MAG: hypothetical protein M3069_27950, partial [Chloroflexota bacterium]|nr:hypothetical protein [Chloroflexota bacterium]